MIESFEGREKFRISIRNLLLDVIADMKDSDLKIKLPNDILEQLLFEEIVINKKENIKAKVLVLTNSEVFRKLDLSHFDFSDVLWSFHSNVWDCVQEHGYENCLRDLNCWRDLLSMFKIPNSNDFSKGKPIYDDENYVLEQLDRIIKTERLGLMFNGYILDFSETNANIDLSQSFSARHCNFPDIRLCEFRGCNVYFSEMPKNGCWVSGCDFSNSKIKLPKSVCLSRDPIIGVNSIVCNKFDNCDLSQTEIDITYDVVGIVSAGSFKNSGIKLVLGQRYLVDRWNEVIDFIYDSFKHRIRDEYIGCCLDEQLFHALTFRSDNEEEKEVEELIDIVAYSIYDQVNSKRQEEEKIKRI